MADYATPTVVGTELLNELIDQCDRSLELAEELNEKIAELRKQSRLPGANWP